MSAAVRLVGYLNAVATRLKDGGVCPDVQVHLDPVDLDALLTQSVRETALRVVFLGATAAPGLDGAQDLDISVAIVAVAGREGRADPAIASADVRVLQLLLDAMALVVADPYFGEVRVTAARTAGLRVAVSERSPDNKSGLAIALVEVSARLLSLVPAWPQLDAVFGTVRPAASPITIDGMEVAP
jgi:hypothetical protein